MKVIDFYIYFFYQVGGVNGLGNLSASDLGIGTGGLGAPFGSGLNTGGAGPMNSSSMHQSNFFLI
jgi:hypothetical protein